MKYHLSFRALIILLFISTMIPLLIIVGLVVFRLQQTYLVNEAQDRLINFVQTNVEAHATNPDLTVLAVTLSEHLRVLGADMFIQDANGNPVPPSLGTGPWLESAQHQAVREVRQGSVKLIGSGATARMVYLSAIVDGSGNMLGSVEASLSMGSINDQLSALRRWLTLIISIASAFSAVLAITLSGVVTRPLESLVASVESVKRGDLETRAHIPAVNELGRLAMTYNQMLDRISNDIHNQTRLVENMRRFAADASHELRSPLSVFRNSVELMDKAISQDDQQQIPEILTLQRKEVDTMAELVDDLLLLARLDQPGETDPPLLRLEEIHPVPFLEEIYERSRLLAKGQQIELVWPTREIDPILADREMLRRALSQIVENAIAYTPPGKQIRLSLDTQGGCCCFIIEDQGMGIAPDEVAKIFERFYRSDESRNRGISGTGLGLAIVAAIVRAHGGEIEVESEPGKGSCFQLLFKQTTPDPL
jgi:two-component system OmpR family sensor kinase